MMACDCGQWEAAVIVAVPTIGPIIDFASNPFPATYDFACCTTSASKASKMASATYTRSTAQQT